MCDQNLSRRCKEIVKEKNHENTLKKDLAINVKCNNSGIKNASTRDQLKVLFGYDMNIDCFNRGYGFEKYFKKVSIEVLKMLEIPADITNKNSILVDLNKKGNFFDTTVKYLERVVDEESKVNIRVMNLMNTLVYYRDFKMSDIENDLDYDKNLNKVLDDLFADKIFSFSPFTSKQLFWMLKKFAEKNKEFFIPSYAMKQVLEFQRFNKLDDRKLFVKFLPYILSPVQTDVIRITFSLIKKIKNLSYSKKYEEYEYVRILFRTVFISSGFKPADIFYVIQFFEKVEFDKIPQIFAGSLLRK